MYLEEQNYWVDLLNVAATWSDDSVDIVRLVPERFRDFETLPNWSRDRATAYLRNNLESLSAAHAALESGAPIDYDSINNVIENCTLRLFDWGDPTALRAIRRSKAGRGTRLETLQASGPRDGLNPGSGFLRSTVERAFYYFARYADHRLADPVYPESSANTLRVLRCARERCGRLFVRATGNSHHCSASCGGAS